MAGESFLADVTNALSQLYAKKLERQFNRITVLSKHIESVPDVQGNAKNVAWDVEMSGTFPTALSYAEGTDVANSELVVDVPLPAILNWAFYRTAFQISEAQIDAAFASRGSADAVMKILDERILSNGAKLASAVNVDMWSGTGTDGSGNPNIIGLSGGALSAASYAGLTTGAYAEWAGNVLSNGGNARALTLDLLEQAEQNAWTGAGESPNLIVCSPGVWRKYIGLFEPIRRVFGPGPMPHYGTSVGANSGIDSTVLDFKGIPVYRDKDAPAGTLLMLNTKFVKKAYLPPTRDASVSAVGGASDSEGAGFNGDEVKTPVDLPFRLEALAKNGDSVKMMIKTVCQLQVLRRNAHSLISDISEA